MSHVARSARLATAEGHAARRDWARAIAVYETILQQAPADAHVLLQLSYMHSLAGHYRRARDYTLRAHAAGPDAVEDVKELVARLRTFNAAEALLEALQRRLPVSRMSIPLLLAFAAQLTYLNLPSRALELLDEARRADPDYPPTLMSRAQVLIYLGRFADARQDLQRVLRRAPHIPHAHWLMAQVGDPSGASARAHAIHALLQKPGLSPGDVASLGFALHREWDAAGEHARAWEALQLGCRAKRSTLQYDMAQTAELFGALHAVAASARAGCGTVPPEASATAPRPIFIVGMHRSGTTLLEQMLDGHPDVEGLGELYDFTSAMRHATDHHCRGVIDLELVRRAPDVDVVAVGKSYLDGVAWRLPTDISAFTDKLPSNFLHAGFICRALPQARLLHMRRDPIETCFSNLRELFSDANAYSYDQRELADWHLRHDALMEAWRAAFPQHVIDLDYTALVSDPRAQMQRVCAALELPFAESMLDIAARRRGVVTASAVQVRSDVQAAAQPKWKPYERWLAPLIDALAAGRRD